MKDIDAWLAKIGLAKLAETFRANDIDFDVLPALSEEQLKELGLSMGDRVRLLRAIKMLASQTTGKGSSTPTPISMTASPERRQLTVVFVDLVDSTPLSQVLDPEDLRDVMRNYHDTVAKSIRDEGGFIAKFMGDGVLAYFGYPQATEDAAERAVRACLRAVSAVKELPAAQDRQLAARAGIATGPVVVGDVIGDEVAREVNVVGATPNLAARLLGLGKPHSVIISNSTRRLVGELFVVDALGPQLLKGIDDPVAAFEVKREQVGLSRFEAIRPSQRSQFVGRAEELALILRRWELATTGEGQVVLISGEPGLGKSRLSDTFCRRIDERPHYLIQYQCSPQHTNSSLYPVVKHLSFVAGIEASDPPTAKLDKLSSLFDQSGLLEKQVRQIAPLLNIDVPTNKGDVDLTPQQRRECFFEVLVKYFDALANKQPTLLFVEDAHWIDPTTQELIHRLASRVDKLHAMVLVTFRPEYQAPWVQHSTTTSVTLNRLTRSQVATLLTALAGSKSLPDSVVEHIVSRTDGVPLFIEEMFQGLRESGSLFEEAASYRLTRALNEQTVPVSLHDSLMARLDRLSQAKVVAQVGAVIGREFSYSLLEAVAALDSGNLQTALRALIKAGLVFAHGEPPDAIYTFKHALIQDAAHQSLLKRHRQQLHARVAAVLAESHTDTTKAPPELLAQHYDEAGRAIDAAQSWLEAGRLALAKSAAGEAISQLRRGIDSVRSLEATSDRTKLELELLISLGQAYMATNGYASPEATAILSEAERISREGNHNQEQMRALLSLRASNQVRGNLVEALRVASEVLAVSSKAHDDTFVVQSFMGMAHTHCYMGKFPEAVDNLSEVLRRYDISQQTNYLRIFGLDPKVFALSVMGWNEWYLGRLDHSLTAATGAIAFAKEFGNPLNLEHAFSSAARVHLLRREPERVSFYCDAAIDISRRYEFKMRLAITKIWQGWLANARGDSDNAVTKITEGLSEYRASGAGADMTVFLTLLSEALHKAGRSGEALNTLAEADALVRKSGERWWAAEVHRMIGDIYSSDGSNRNEGAEQQYREAVGIAKEQQARSWELRSALALSRLLCNEGRSGEAGAILRPIFGEFTEGLETPDLVDAKALLAKIDVA